MKKEFVLFESAFAEAPPQRAVCGPAHRQARLMSSTLMIGGVRFVYSPFLLCPQRLREQFDVAPIARIGCRSTAVRSIAGMNTVLLNTSRKTMRPPYADATAANTASTGMISTTAFPVAKRKKNSSFPSWHSGRAVEAVGRPALSLVEGGPAHTGGRGRHSCFRQSSALIPALRRPPSESSSIAPVPAASTEASDSTVARTVRVPAQTPRHSAHNKPR